MAKKRRLLVLGPSFRRRRESELLPAFERFDGLFFRVARKYLGDVRDVDVVVMVDDSTLVDGSAPLAYSAPAGSGWGKQKFSKESLEKAKVKNEEFLGKRLKNGKYSEVYLAMGKQYAEALPDLKKYGVEVVFPTSGGPGPKARALKAWLSGEANYEP
ncbi:MAG: hypothetical protein ACPLKZ_02400 [Candidatus Bathyarchaeales archaeon]